MTTPRPVTAMRPGTTPTSSPMYYEFHIPLGIYNAIRNLLEQQVDNPNSPNPIVDASKGREWFSQPRPAAQGDIPKPTFFYATGTAHIIDLFGVGYGQIGGGSNWVIPGLDDQVYFWDGAPANDPFYRMVDQSLWNTKRIEFANSAFPMSVSIAEGVKRTIDMINDTPGAFALGGYSQGAAVVSRVYDEIRFGSLKHRKPDLLAGVTFGNPNREAGHLWPGANPVPGWDTPNDFMSHGCFPLSQRLKNTETLWWDFSNENEIISAVPTSQQGIDWVSIVGTFLNGFNGRDWAAFVQSQLSNLRFNLLGDVFDLVNAVMAIGGDPSNSKNPHMLYPVEPPPGNPRNGLTSYQIALQYLREVGQQFKTARQFAQKTEVLQVNFKLPMPINDVSFQAVKVPVQIDMWYRDRQDNWRAVLDENRNPVTLTLPASTEESWHSYHAYTAPTVAKAVQFRLTRQADSLMGTRPYCVGMRNILMRRNIYDRPAGIRATTITEDALGNVVETYLRDWDAPKAIDNNPDTFWRSAAQPSPDAVVSMYLDVRTADGSPQIIDTLSLDPVYTGNALNVYYTNDEPEGVTLEPSPISVVPTTEMHTRWQAGRGLWDVSTGAETSEFTAPFRVGPLVKKNCWIGVEWSPDFSATSPPGNNPVLLEIIPDNPEPGQFWPRLYYDVGNLGYGKIVLEFTNGTTSKYFEAPLSPALTQNEPLRIVAGWAYDVPGSAVFISVMSKGKEVGYSYTPNTLTLPSLVTLDGQISFSKFRGQFTAHVIKLASWLNSHESFMVNPIAYTDPDPITPDANGKVTSSSLDNAVFSCDWTSQRFPVGGTTPSMHVDRRWTPIWRDYTVQRGKIFFPRQISCKYLKLEFSKLTAEPYPVYDTGIQTTYEVFPVSVYADVTTTTTTTSSIPGTTTQTVALPSQQVHTPGAIENIASSIGGAINAIGNSVNGLLGAIGNLVGGIASVNWLDPRSVTAAAEATAVTTTQPIQNAIGAAAESPTIPNTVSTALGQSTGAMAAPGTSIAVREEASNSLVYRRGSVQPQVLAGQTVNQIMGALPNQGLGATVSTPVATAISTTFAPTVSSPGAAPVTPAMGTDWWLFPGALLKMPAAILESIFSGVQWGLFGTNSTVPGGTRSITTPTTTTVSNTTSTTQRVRFNTTETHVYNKLVVTRTSAIGYFAGIREVAAYNTTYIDYEDPLAFDFKVYDPNQWRFTNVKQVTTGAVTTNGSPYTDADLDFYNLDSWDRVGDWSWDGTQDGYSGNRVGSATIVANGTEVSLTANKPFKVSPSDEVVIGASVKFVGAESATYPDAFGDAYQGLYDNGADYQPGDVVLYSGFYYRRTGEANPGYAPGSAYWSDPIDPESKVVMELVTYKNGEEVGVVSLNPAPANAPADGYTPPDPLNGSGTRVKILNPTGKTDGVTFTHLLGTYTVPEEDVDALAIRFRITAGVTAGQFWIAEAKAEPRNGGRAFLYDRFITFSKFNKVICDFRDSGLRRSDSMWAKTDPLNKNIDDGTLAWYTSPTTMPAGMWGDQFAKWADENVKWGNARATVAIWIDPERQYKGNRSLHFRRAAGAGSAGVRVIQQTNYFPGAQVRICCTFYKPVQDGNYITLRLRRVSDGVYIHEEIIPDVPVEQWYTYQSSFFELPDTLDQVYILELDLTGTFEDDLYVSDLYTEVAHVRYFMRLGGVSNPNAVNIDVTELAHTPSDAIVTCTEPTNEVALEVVLLTPLAVAYGCTLTPVYQQ